MIKQDFDNLTSEEVKAAANFHKSRVAFAELPDGRVVTLQDDPREHRDWLREDYGINAEDFELLIRGYTKDNKVIFYKGMEFKPVNDKQHIFEIVDILGEIAENKDIYDGVIIGAIGEEWKPMNKIYDAVTKQRI